MLPTSSYIKKWKDDKLVQVECALQTFLGQSVCFTFALSQAFPYLSGLKWVLPQNVFYPKLASIIPCDCLVGQHWAYPRDFIHLLNCCNWTLLWLTGSASPSYSFKEVLVTHITEGLYPFSVPMCLRESDPVRIRWSGLGSQSQCNYSNNLIIPCTVFSWEQLAAQLSLEIKILWGIIVSVSTWSLRIEKYI